VCNVVAVDHKGSRQRFAVSCMFHLAEHDYYNCTRLTRDLWAHPRNFGWSVVSEINKDLGLEAKTKDLGLKAKAKDSRSHKANVQRQCLTVKDDNDHKFYAFNS